MNGPLVSVLIPAFNAENYIADCIDSVIQQSWKNIEIIIIDDGSTENTCKVINRFLRDNRVKAFSQRRSGLSSTRNSLISHATGKFIQLLDADDMLGRDKIKSQVEILQNNCNSIAVSETIHFNDGTNHLLDGVREGFDIAITQNPFEFLIRLWGGNDGIFHMVHPASWLIPKKIIDDIGLWNLKLRKDIDGEFLARVVLNSRRIHALPHVSMYYRKYPNNRKKANITSDNSYEAYQSVYLSIKLKMEHLRKYTNDKRISRCVGIMLMNLAISSYPSHKDISQLCIRDIVDLGVSIRCPIMGGTPIEVIKKTFGWKLAKRLQLTYRRMIH